MSAPDPQPKVLREAERSAVVASPEPVCEVCQKPRPTGRRATCSDRCRTELNRGRRRDALRTRDDEIRALLVLALKRIEERGPVNPRPRDNNNPGQGKEQPWHICERC